MGQFHFGDFAHFPIGTNAQTDILQPGSSDCTTNLNLSTEVLDVVQCEGLWAWATTPPMPPYHIHAVAEFGDPARTSDISKMVLSIVKFGGAYRDAHL